MRALHVLAALVVLGATATAALGTPPGKNGQIMFRRYLDTQRTTGALFAMNPDGTGVKQITRPRRGVVDQFGDWSPNGTRIAFERKEPCPPDGMRNGLDGTCDRIYTARRDGKGFLALVPCGFEVTKPFPGTCVGARTPAWSPDGTKLAFRYSIVDRTYVDSFNTSIGIWVVNADGSGRRQVTQLTPGSSWDREPQWSPDGTRLAFVRDDLDRKGEAIFTVNLDGTGLLQVTPWDLRAGTRPDWSPDGNWIVFGAAPGGGGKQDVYKIRPDGTGLTRLTTDSRMRFSYLSSSFSPDGTRIVTARTPGTGAGGAADLFVMNADGSDPRPLTRTTLWESSVDWGSQR